MKHSAKRIRNGKYMYRGFVLKRGSELNAWFAVNGGKEPLMHFTFELIKRRVDQFLDTN